MEQERIIAWDAEALGRQLRQGTGPFLKERRVIPGLLDVYAAKTGYQTQQTDQPASPDRQDNLWAALPGDHGAQGTFGSRSRTTSPALWVVMHEHKLAAAAAGMLTAAGLDAIKKMR